MKTIIATIKPIHLGNIRRGVKTVEVRRNRPNCEHPFKVLCCESGSNGQIKAEFVCKDIITLTRHFVGIAESHGLCLREDEFLDYMGDKPFLYGWCISGMIDYCSTKGYCVRNISEFGLKRAPQSW